MWTLSVWFLGSLAACLLLVKLVPGLRGLMSAFAGHMAPRAFPGDSTFEHNKFKPVETEVVCKLDYKIAYRK